MTYNLHDVQAYVQGEKAGVYSLKLEIYDLGIYVHGATYRKSKKNEEWWLQPPKHKLSNGQYKAPVEFDTRTELWAIMYKAATDAVNEYRRFL